MIELTDKEIDVDLVIRSVQDPSTGGTSVFIGTTRNHSVGKEVLEMAYQAYIPMALTKMNELAENVRSKWKLKNVSIVHRVGRLQIGEASVVIAVSAPHRKEA